MPFRWPWKWAGSHLDHRSNPGNSSQSGTEISDSSLYKIVVMGENGTGKSSLCERYLHDSFTTNGHYNPTVGVEMNLKFFILNDSIRMRFWVWDSGHYFIQRQGLLLKGARGAILVYDVTNRRSFEEIKSWLTDVDSFRNPRLSKLLVATKCDLVEEREVSFKEASDFAKDFGMFVLETSAKDGTNVERAFVGVVAQIHSYDSTH